MKVSDKTNFAELYMFPLENLLNIIPSNVIIYFDSGLWGLYDDSFNSLIDCELDWGLKELVIYYLLSIDLNEIIDGNWYKLYE